MFKCEFCGFVFSDHEAKGSCASCPLSSCEKLKCPNCGYEYLPEPGLIKIIRGWTRGKGTRKEDRG